MDAGKVNIFSHVLFRSSFWVQLGIIIKFFKTVLTYFLSSFVSIPNNLREIIPALPPPPHPPSFSFAQAPISDS